jgi:hypothetical protein
LGTGEIERWDDATAAAMTFPSAVFLAAGLLAATFLAGSLLAACFGAGVGVSEDFFSLAIRLHILLTIGIRQANS